MPDNTTAEHLRATHQPETPVPPEHVNPAPCGAVGDRSGKSEMPSLAAITAQLNSDAVVWYGDDAALQ